MSTTTEKIKFNIETISNQSFELAEGPHWNPLDRKLYFVDIIGGLVCSIDDDNNKNFNKLFECNNKYISAVFPVDDINGGENDNSTGGAGGDNNENHRNQNIIVFSVGTELFKLNLKTNEKIFIAKIDKNNVRFNDGKCDPLGRIWIGTMAIESKPGVLEPEQGALYRLNGNQLEVQQDKVTLSNGICWSLDFKKMYFIDSIARTVFVFKYDLKTGNISDKSVFLNMNDDAENFTKNELPDGMTIDMNGNLWIAMFFGGRIVNIDGNTGKFIQSIKMPTSLITSVCFGGENFDQMFVTSSKKFLDEEAKKNQPLAGFIFKITSNDSKFKGHPNFHAVLSQ